MARRTLLPIALLAAFGAAACGTSAEPRPDPPRSTSTAGASHAAAPPSPPRVLVDLVDALPSCDDRPPRAAPRRRHRRHDRPVRLGARRPRRRHRGRARRLDLGPLHRSEGRRSRSRSLATTPIFVAARAVGYGAKSASVLLDDQPLGTLALHREQIRVAADRRHHAPGRSRLAHAHAPLLRARARRRRLRRRRLDPRRRPRRELRRVRPAHAAATSSSPPPRSRGVPHRSLALRAPGSVRCAVRASPGEPHLRAAVGAPGRRATGEAEIRVVRDGKKAELHPHGARSRGVRRPRGSTSICRSPGLRPRRSARSSSPRPRRRAAGACSSAIPAIVLPPAPATRLPPARAVVIVVLDGVERARAPALERGPAVHACPRSPISRRRAPSSSGTARPPRSSPR